MITLEINGSETDTVRLFHLDLPPEAVDRFCNQAGTGEWPLQYALGASKLRPAFVEVVAIRDLGSMPLSQYLAEAHGATGPEFRAAQEDINALDGHVVILPAQAFDHTSQTLTVAAPLYHVGTYGETKAHGAGPKLRSDSARRGQNGATASTGTGNSRMLRLLVAAVAAAILIVIAYALL